MKKIKILFLLFTIILLSGCSGTYNLKINDDFSIDENVNFIIENKDENTLSKTKKLFTDNNISSKKYKIVASKKNITIDYSEKYTSLEDYILNSKLYKQMFKDIDYSYVNGILKFDTKSTMLLEDNGVSTLYNNYNISMFQINIESPFIINSSNADIENEDILSWTFNKNTREKQISVEYDAQGSRSKVSDIIVISMIVVITIGSIVVVIIRFYNGRKL